MASIPTYIHTNIYAMCASVYFSISFALAFILGLSRSFSCAYRMGLMRHTQQQQHNTLTHTLTHKHILRVHTFEFFAGMVVVAIAAATASCCLALYSIILVCVYLCARACVFAFALAPTIVANVHFYFDEAK